MVVPVGRVRTAPLREPPVARAAMAAPAAPQVLVAQGFHSQWRFGRYGGNAGVGGEWWYRRERWYRCRIYHHGQGDRSRGRPGGNSGAGGAAAQVAPGVGEHGGNGGTGGQGANGSTAAGSLRWHGRDGGARRYRGCWWQQVPQPVAVRVVRRVTPVSAVGGTGGNGGTGAGATTDERPVSRAAPAVTVVPAALRNTGGTTRCRRARQQRWYRRAGANSSTTRRSLRWHGWRWRCRRYRRCRWQRWFDRGGRRGSTAGNAGVGGSGGTGSNGGTGAGATTDRRPVWRARRR